MKVLFFLINMNLGGTEKSFLNLLSAMPADVATDVLLLEKSGALLDELPPQVSVSTPANNDLLNLYFKWGSRRFGFRQLKKGRVGLFLRCMVQFVLYRLKWIRNPFWALKPKIASLSESYDVAVAYAGIHDFIAWYTLEKITAKKKILWVHFDVEKVQRDTSFGRRWYHRFQQIFCVSEKATKVFQKRYPTSSEITSTFNNIISSSVIHKEAKDAETFEGNEKELRILTLGRLSKEKGQQMIPAVVRRLRDDGFSFKWYLIGEGKLEETLLADIKKMNIQNYLILLGAKLNPYSYLKDCDLYVQTSLYEGDPVALKEAKVFQKPVVATAFTTVQDIIENGNNGRIVAISEDGLYEGVKEILAHPDLLKKFAKPALSETNCKERIQELLALSN